MVTLVVNDYEQVSLLESALENANIAYTIELGDSNKGIRPPYLIVDGVPLDEVRAMR